MTSDFKRQLKDIKNRINILNNKDLPIICRDADKDKYTKDELKKMVIVRVDNTDKSVLNDKLYQRFKDRKNGGN